MKRRRIALTGAVISGVASVLVAVALHTEGAVREPAMKPPPLLSVAAMHSPARSNLEDILTMKRRRIALASAVITVVAIALFTVIARDEDSVRETAKPPPVLSVMVTRPLEEMLPVRVAASGNFAAWQEASVGAEADGLRLTEVRVNVGDTVRRGQVLARFNADIVDAELAEAQAAVAQADAEVAEADANATRARGLDRSGALSAQQVDQYVIAARTARARRDAVRAVVQRQRLRLAQTRVLAPSDGIVTSRTATVGAVVPAGQELFRLIRDGRLEWRAAVAVSDLDQLAPGQVATIRIDGHVSVQGTLRMVAPAIDPQTRDGLIYVDLPRHDAIRAGAFARGHVEVGEGLALTVPQSAVLPRDGFDYVMLVSPASAVVMRKVSLGRRVGGRIEITQGLAASESVIASGLSFLSEGDTVRVVSDATDGTAPQRAAHDRAASSGGKS
ncbi:efflux RND transporter periplasmic adaptor subunit [Tahibacter sp.]|uniref:efflux RND transporter periplasmic adaptor subunit n=1 Tax=Tahibacter sp. TaxID=2056211 RepID=UPI0028C50B62|nr:efflux RND transporter periplasmic adaptor subunit [Tahibacter sp.]